MGGELKKKFIRVTLDDKKCVVEVADALGIISAELEALLVGESFTVSAIEMTQEEFDNLGEFEGW